MANKQTKAKEAKKAQKPQTIYSLLLKLLILTVIIIGIIVFVEKKGWFRSDATNNHTEKKWDSFYQFTSKNEVDIVLVGNSRLYTGINPKNLSNTLNVNAFCLASPGTTLSDAYFCVKEAVSRRKPKMVVVETGTLSDYNSHQMSADGLMNQMKSFKARRNVPIKLASTPLLFTPNQWAAAWADGIRNHSFIFSDREQIEKNRQGKNILPNLGGGGLYLGRYVRFTTGISDATLAEINKPGTPKDDGNDFKIGAEASRYLQKLSQLCEENNIELVFFTVPIYDKLVVNHDVKHEKMAKALAPYKHQWLDLQQDYDTVNFQPDCFEDVASPGQHSTYTGSLLFTYKLAHFIREHFAAQLPDRSNNINWLQLFYGDEGFFENHSIPQNTLFKDVALPDSPLIKELNIIPQNDFNLLYLKLERNPNFALAGKTIHLLVDGRMDGHPVTTPITFQSDKRYDPVKHHLFMTALQKNFVIDRIVKMTIE